MAWEGGYEWYQSKGIIFLYISDNLKKNFKGSRPFKKQKNDELEADRLIPLTPPPPVPLDSTFNQHMLHYVHM
jgi:hypothetical protein